MTKGMVINMKDKKIGFAILGCGVVANYHSAAIFELSDSATLVGVADNKYERAKAFADEHETYAFKDFDEVLKCPEVNVVCICTPSGLHAEAAIAAAKAGKHLVIEKPLGITKEQLDAVEQACEEKNIKAACILQSRFYRSIRKVKTAINEGILGRIVCADVYMKYSRTQQYYDSSKWRGTKAIDGGGALMNQGIHGVDLLMYMAGDVKSVFAYSKTLARNIEVEDTLVCVLEFESGATGVIEATTSVYPGYPRLLNIHGDKGTISLEENLIVRWDIETSANEEDLVITPIRFSAAHTPTAISPDGHMLQIEDMVNAIKEDRKPMIDCAEGRKCVDIILAIYRSAEEKKVVYISK